MTVNLWFKANIFFNRAHLFVRPAQLQPIGPQSSITHSVPSKRCVYFTVKQKDTNPIVSHAERSSPRPYVSERPTLSNTAKFNSYGEMTICQDRFTYNENRSRCTFSTLDCQSESVIERLYPVYTPCSGKSAAWNCSCALYTVANGLNVLHPLPTPASPSRIVIEIDLFELLVDRNSSGCRNTEAVGEPARVYTRRVSAKPGLENYVPVIVGWKREGVGHGGGGGLSRRFDVSANCRRLLQRGSRITRKICRTNRYSPLYTVKTVYGARYTLGPSHTCGAP